MNKIIYILILVICITINSCSPGRSTDDPNKNNDGLIMGLVGIPSQDANTVVTGTLNDASGSPLTFATLTLGGTSSSAQAKEAVSTTTKTDATGKFTLYLKVGTFSIQVTKADGIVLGSFQMKVSSSATTPAVSGMPSSLGVTGLVGGKPGTTPTTPSTPTIPASPTSTLPITPPTSITFNTGIVPSGWNSNGGNWTITSSGCAAGYGTCLRSGSIGNSSSTSISVAKSTASGTVSFIWNVSSESGYDYCKFYIDGNLQSGQISGSPGWGSMQFAISSGLHTFRWEYSKDGSVVSGFDTCYIDEVFLP